MKSFLNEKITKLKKIDIIIISVITILYGIFSFYNLGDLNAPQTYNKINEKESILIELNKEDYITKIKLYNMDSTSTYTIEVSIDNENYEYVDTITGNGAFAWTEDKIFKTAKYIKITSKTTSYIGEISLYNNSKKKIKISSVTKNNKKITNLTDEQNLVPKKISYMNSSYFDEIYFARTAYEYIHNMPIYEWTHPPLGKLIQAIPIKISNTMSPFYYRFMGNIAGILLIPLMYLFGKELFKKRKYAIFASLLITFDTFHFVESRMGVVDSYLMLFILSSFYFMIKYIHNNKERSLLLSGFFFGLASSVKWIGLYCGLGLAIIFFVHVLTKKKLTIKLFLKCILFFVIIPTLIYLSSYFVLPKLLNINYSFSNFITLQQEMFNYHSSLKDEHFFSSKWYTWPATIKPVWYYTSTYDTTHRASITGIGNIAIWWVGIIALIYLLFKIIKKKDKNSIYLLLIFLSLYIPYIFIGRVMFLYHFATIIPFVMLMIVNMFKDLEETLKVDIIIPLYLVLVIIVFIIYYPVASGLPVSNDYLDKIKLLSTWYW